jgi:hypothetical protein
VIGRLAARAAGGALSSAARGQQGPDPYRVSPDSEAGRKSGCLGIVIFFGLLGPMIAVLKSGYDGHVSLGACEGYVTGFGVLLALCLVLGAAAGAVSRRAVVRRYAAAEPDRTAQSFRDAAARLRRLERPAWTVTARQETLLLSLPCPVRGCRAVAGNLCSPLPYRAPYAVLSRAVPEAVVHSARIRDIVRYGSADAAHVAAQFDNVVPPGVL